MEKIGNAYLENRLNLEQVLKGISEKEIEYITIYIISTAQVMSKRVSAAHFVKEIKDNGIKIPVLACQFSVNNDVLMTEHYNMDNLVDILIKIDLDTGFRRMAWLGKNHVLCFGVMLDFEGNLTNNFPRNMLKKLLLKTEKETGITFKHAPELEYYIFNKTISKIVSEYPGIDLKKSAYSDKPSDYCIATESDKSEEFNDKIKKNIIGSGVDLELCFSEHGPGQQELNIKYEEVLNSADSHIILKQCIKHVAYNHNIGASFMPKPYSDKDGNSCHIHISAYKEGKSIFMPSENEEENAFIEVSKERKEKCNKNLLYFIGGLCKYVPEMFLIFANNVNSYKRYKTNTFVPLYSNTWCYDSRTTGIRVVGEGKSIHIEVRFPGSDANAYLLPACIIAAGTEGIKHKIDAPPMNTGNNDNYDKNTKFQLKQVPANLSESIKIFEKSEFSKQFLGEELFDGLIVIAKNEWDTYNEHISAFEIKRYMDLL